MSGDRGRVYGGQSEQERRSERRDRLMAAGVVLFGTDGWEGTGIERICTEAGVSTRYFYEEFRGRDDLLEAIYRSTAESTVAVVLAVLAGPGTPEERVADGLRAYMRHVTAVPGRVRLLYMDARRLPAVAPIVRRILVRYWWSMTEIAAGRPLPTGPPPVFDDATTTRVRAVSGAIIEVLTHWQAMPEPRRPVEPMIERVVGMLTPTILSSARRS